ncbi:MAG: ArsR family transcriptional regulator [Anaerolineae bacterium]|nr:ArsR family transcriptional regulator [Anaerolineae bacterium]
MQPTRQHILEILKERENATVEEIVEALEPRIGLITAVTVRHHLEILRGDGLIAAPTVRRRTTPGRLQHIYMLTNKALDLFPNNYRSLAEGMMVHLKAQLPSHEVNVILEAVAEQMANDARIDNLPLPARLNQVVEYLTEQGYNASWEMREDGFVLHTSNCPYHHLVTEHAELCGMDMQMISKLLGGIVPRRVSHLADGGESCAYLIPSPNATRSAA